MKKTQVIRYNLHERGRKYRGQDRSNIDFTNVIAYINGPICQERVKNRDMFGFYGHFARMKYGLSPQEVGQVRGEAPVTLIPAFITTKLYANKDGTVEHQAEFLETEPGKICAKLYESKVGGFSSAISADKRILHGFDYVLEPNYTTNRGYDMFDSVNIANVSDQELAQRIYDEQSQALLALLDQKELALKMAGETIEHLKEENNHYLSMLTNDRSGTLDSVEPTELPIVTGGGATGRLVRDVQLFRSVRTLPRFKEPQEETKSAPQPTDPLYSMLLRRK